MRTHTQMYAHIHNHILYYTVCIHPKCLCLMNICWQFNDEEERRYKARTETSQAGLEHKITKWMEKFPGFRQFREFPWWAHGGWWCLKAFSRRKVKQYLFSVIPLIDSETNVSPLKQGHDLYFWTFIVELIAMLYILFGFTTLRSLFCGWVWFSALLWVGDWAITKALRLVMHCALFVVLMWVLIALSTNRFSGAMVLFLFSQVYIGVYIHIHLVPTF